MSVLTGSWLEHYSIQAGSYLTIMGWKHGAVLLGSRYDFVYAEGKWY